MIRKTKSETILILHNLRSRENVGSIFRTADAAGVSKLYLVGTTPRPVDRFGRKDTKVAKASLGAEEFVLWEYAQSITPVVSKLRTQKWKLVAVEQSARATSLYKFKRSSKTCFIFGNEVTGVPARVLTQVDTILEIPMRGRKESLNVAVSAGIVLFSK